MSSSLIRHWHRFCAFVLITVPRVAFAESEVLGNADEINLGSTSDADPKQFIIDIVQAVLQFVALIAVIMIIIAGIWLIVGFGEDSSKEKAKKIIIYTIVGLLIILLAEAIVQFVLDIGQSN